MGPLILIIAVGVILFSGAMGAQTKPAPEPDPESPDGGGEADLSYYPETDDILGRFDALFNKYCDQYDVPILWAKAICMNESSMGENELVKNGDVSPDGLSKGVMQLTLATAQQYEPATSFDNLNDPEISIRIACKLIRDIMKSFDIVDLRYNEWCVKSYNRGVSRTKQERDGVPRGLAEPGFSRGNEYWARWQRNFVRLGGEL